MQTGLKHFLAQPFDTSRLTVRGWGHHERMPPGVIDRPGGTGDHLLMMFYHPVRIGTEASDAEHVPVTLFVWAPGRRQYYGHPTRPFTHTWLHADGPFLRALLRQSHLPLHQPLCVADPTAMERPLLALHEELCEHVTPDAALVHNHVDTLVRQLARQVRDAGSDRLVPEPILRVRRHIESHPEQPIRLSDLATIADLTPQHLCTQFKRYFHLPPIEYLIQQRLARAAYLLRDHNLSVTQVAARVGYDDLYHFSRLFKRHYGRSPRTFRQGVTTSPRETPAKTVL